MLYDGTIIHDGVCINVYMHNSMRMIHVCVCIRRANVTKFVLRCVFRVRRLSAHLLVLCSEESEQNEREGCGPAPPDPESQNSNQRQHEKSID
jgi:hypothetical protein